jgi:hypothetical protein
MNPRNFYLVDIDGTLADLSHRLHFIHNNPADWDGFFAACGKDSPIIDVIKVVCALKREDTLLLMVTGRSDAVKDATIEWLNNWQIPFDAIYMRKAGDHRQDDIVKGELLDQILKDYDINECSIDGVFEDRDQVVKMYRSRGLRVYQVADGNF